MLSGTVQLLIPDALRCSTTWPFSSQALAASPNVTTTQAMACTRLTELAVIPLQGDGLELE